ncbi:MAG: YebC/PmpR family DNA-binding transcriptional regulator [Planctomycetes bacterium]|nr:YebC/PmpR family DNA-binding transcriptional regulator [Planctomycetota bacterium]
MAGHSHSANIARRKGAVDAKRGKVFSKLARAIISAARQGGGDPDANLKLRYAIDKARASNVPKDTIERAIQRGSGSKESDAFEEVIYEGYAPGGIALMVACLTDNRHRTSPDVKHAFDKHGGNLGSPGSVAFMFQLKSVIAIATAGRDEDQLTELALEVGADDVEIDGETAVLTAGPTQFIPLKGALEKAAQRILAAELEYVPSNRVPLADKEEARKLLKLIDVLEDNDDVQNVYANYDMPAEWLDELTGA